MKENLIIILLLISACTKQKPSNNEIKDLKKSSDVETKTIVANKMQFENDEFSYSNYSFMQANNSGLYVTPSTTVDDYVLYRYQINSTKNTIDIKGVVKEGRGPNEKERISMSTKSVSGDSLLFSSSGNKTLIVNLKGEVSEWKVETNKLPNMGFSFSYSNGKLLIPSFNPVQKKYLFEIFDTKSRSINFAFPPRVPYGFQPSIRNEILGETPIPNGFAISFLGDRKVYILNEKGIVKKEILLGETDEIPKPYKIDNPQESKGAKPYITKLEFYKNNMLVLMDNIIWFIEYPSFEVKTKLKLLTEEKQKNSPVLDFSISDDYLYTRIGRKGIFFVETDKNWISF